MIGTGREEAQNVTQILSDVFPTTVALSTELRSGGQSSYIIEICRVVCLNTAKRLSQAQNDSVAPYHGRYSVFVDTFGGYSLMVMVLLLVRVLLVGGGFCWSS